MGLETGTYISSLNPANPTTGDSKTEGDDHIRLIKSTLLATFPNVTGAVTPTHTELNYVDGVTSDIQTQLNAKLGNTNWSISSNRLLNNGNTQPSFHAYLTSAQTSGTTFIFNAENHDYGSVYNAGTGVFTVPVTGVYLLCATLQLTNTTGSTTEPTLSIYDGGTYLASEDVNIPNSTTGTVSLSVVVLLSSSATVTCESNVTFSANYGPYTAVSACRFSGRLLG